MSRKTVKKQPAASTNGKMKVRKRNGKLEDVFFDKITSRIKKLCYNLHMDIVSPEKITMKVISGIYNEVSTIELDNLAAETAAQMSVNHPDYAILAARIAVSNLHKETKKLFSDVITDLYQLRSNKKAKPLICEKTYSIVMKNKDKINSKVIYDRDYEYNYFGFKTLERSYLMKIDGLTVERPQHMLMRVSLGIHGEDLEGAFETYDYMSKKILHSCFTNAF